MQLSPDLPGTRLKRLRKSLSAIGYGEPHEQVVANCRDVEFPIRLLVSRLRGLFSRGYAKRQSSFSAPCGTHAPSIEISQRAETLCAHTG